LKPDQQKRGFWVRGSFQEKGGFWSRGGQVIKPKLPHAKVQTHEVKIVAIRNSFLWF